MMTRTKLGGLGMVASLLVAIVPACSMVGEEVCLTYACVNQASLTGEVGLPEGTRDVTVKYCSAAECVEGTLDVSDVGTEKKCTGPAAARFSSDVCFTRDASGVLRVEAVLGGEDDMTLPADGERYTLTIVDEASRETLLDETRSADYETTRQDNCHLCWNAEMSL